MDAWEVLFGATPEQRDRHGQRTEALEAAREPHLGGVAHGRRERGHRAREGGLDVALHSRPERRVRRQEAGEASGHHVPRKERQQHAVRACGTEQGDRPRRPRRAIEQSVCEHYALDNASALATNRDVQVGVFLVNHLHLAVVQDRGLDAPLSLGLSLGEYNHLVHIGAISFEEAMRLVDARGEAYDQGPAGAMAAVFPIELEALEDVVRRARAHGFLEIGNLNTPTQHVLSGERAAVDAALALLEDEHFVQGRIIEHRIPMHSARFAPAAALLRPALERAAWRVPTKPYLANVRGEVLECPSAGQIIEMLFEHVFRPVLWRKSIELVTARFPDASFIEVGPGTVLFNMLQRKWVANQRHATDRPEGLRDLTTEGQTRAG